MSTGTFIEEYDALSGRISVLYDVAQAKGAAAPMPATRDTYGLSTYINSIPTWHASDYIQNGLILCWDGIENAGRRTHLSDLTSVYDHSGNGYGGTMLSAEALSNCFHIYGPCAMVYNNACQKVKDAITANAITIETVAKRIDWDTPTSAALWSNADAVNNCIRARADGEYMPYRVRWRNVNRGAGDSTHLSACLQRGQINTIANVCSLSVLQLYADGISRRYESFSNGGANSPISAFMSVGGVGLNGTQQWLDMNVYCFRVYDRALTSAEVEYNRMVDTLRFNIPSY